MKPLEQSEKESRVPAGPKSLPGPKKRVLLAKQESTARYELLQQLNKAAFEVELASNGAIAFKKLDEVHLDAIILDSALPDTKGADLLKQIRRKKGFEVIPIFVWSSGGGSLEGWEGRRGKSGATMFFSKATTPVDQIVADVVAHVGAGTRKLVTTGHPAKTHSAGSKTSKGAQPADMSAEIRQFEIAWQKSKPGTPATVPSAVVRENEVPVGEPQLLYWENKLQELTLENVKLQAKVASAEQVDQAKAAAEKAEAAYQAEAARCKQFQEDLVRLGQARDVLNARLAGEARQFAESKQRNEVLAQQLSKSSAELARLKAALENRATEQGLTESELGKKLAAAQTMAEKAEAARKDEVVRGSRVEAELARLSQARAELSGKLVQEQQAAAEFRKRSEELGQRLAESSVALQKAEAELEKQTAARGSVESQLREQLQETKATAETLRATFREQTAVFTSSKEELAALQRSRDDLQARLAKGEQTVAESRRHREEIERRLAESAAELQHVKAELEKQAADRGSVESQLREQLQAAKASAERLNVAYREQTSISTSSKEELAALQRARDEHNARRAREQQAAAESKRQHEKLEAQLRESGIELARLKTQLEHRVAEHGSAESELSEQLAAAKTAAKKAEAAGNEQVEKGRRIEAELTRLKQASVELNGKLVEEEQAAVRSRQRSEDFERRLAASATELQRVKAELNRHLAERAAAESQLREEIQTAKAAAESAEAISREQTSGFTRSKEELAALQRARDEINARLTNEQQAVAEARRQSEDLERRLGESAAELQRVKAELEKQAGSQHGEDQLNVRLAAEQQAAAEFKRHSEELEGRLRESATQFARLQAESENHRAERVSVESRLTKQLEAAHAAADKAQAAHQKEAGRDSHYAEELAKLRLAKTALNGKFLDEQRATEQSKRRVKELEARVARSAAELKRVKAALARKGPARRGGTGVGHAAEHSPADLRVRDSISALARATADLEKERRRLESAVLPSGYSSLNAARLGRAFVNSFRSQLQMPADSLMQSIRRLLELPLNEEQKKLAESALESAILVQASVQQEPPLAAESSPEAKAF